MFKNLGMLKLRMVGRLNMNDALRVEKFHLSSEFSRNVKI